MKDLNELVVNPPEYYLWDFAGVDGLQVAIALFSSSVTHLAPFQFLTTTFEQQSCAVLRLCEGNFRVALAAPVPFDQAVVALGCQIWVNPCQTANLTMPPAVGLARLAQIATTKPLYTLQPFPCDRALRSRIDDIAILAWHHRWHQHPQFLIQTAPADIEAVKTALAASR